jgi:hypothetical protein
VRLTRQEAESVKLAAQERNVAATDLLREGLQRLGLIEEQTYELPRRDETNTQDCDNH